MDEDDLEEEDEKKHHKVSLVFSLVFFTLLSRVIQQVLFEVLAIGTFHAEQNSDLSFKAGEKMQVLDSRYNLQRKVGIHC